MSFILAIAVILWFLKSLKLALTGWTLLPVAIWSYSCYYFIALEGVTLTSTLTSERIAYPSMMLTFTCTTRGSNIQEWYSEAYITGIDDRIQLHEGRRTGSGRAANATIISIGMENGTKVIVSELCIITSSQHLMPTVSCGNNGLGMRKNISFGECTMGPCNN